MEAGFDSHMIDIQASHIMIANYCSLILSVYHTRMILEIFTEFIEIIRNVLHSGKAKFGDFYGPRSENPIDRVPDVP